jgi:hypothetical protein
MSRRADSPTRFIAHKLATLAVVLAIAGCGGGGDSSSTSGPKAANFDIVGHWKGTLHQLGLGSFEVDAQIRSLKSSSENTVSYTVIDCSGTWDYRGRRGNAFEFEENIDSGVGGSCKGSGTVTLTPAGKDTLDYSFSGGGVESRGTVSRVG